MRYTEGKKRMFWFTKEQMEVFDKLEELTNCSKAAIIRDAMNIYLAKLLADKK